MKVLIFSANNDFSAIECATMQLNKGNEVFVLSCDSNMKICMHNKLGNSLYCKLCQHTMLSAWKKSGVFDKIHYYKFSQLIKKQDRDKAFSFNTNFNSITELKDAIYKGAEVGYGAFSSYVSMSRNVMPNISREFKKFIAFLIQKEIELYEVAERLIIENSIELLIFHNGRFSTYKPFLGLAERFRIPYVITEQEYCNDDVMKNYFVNGTPHEMQPIIEHMNKNWEAGKAVEDVEKYAHDFFNKRRNSQAAGDMVYTKDQIKGLLPEKWDKSKENIAIFNSSEDEFCAVSKAFDSYTLYPSQYDALISIFEHYKNDDSKYFYLRIHPNLKNVPYKSHLILYTLQYPNVTIIKPESPVSSYSLLDNCSKVIIFNSTVGLEASYWRKPVIALTHFYYSEFEAVYTPKSQNELWKLIDTKELADRYNEGVLKFAYFLYRKNLPKFEYVSYKYIDFKFLRTRLSGAMVMKFLNSYKIMAIIEFLINRIPFPSPINRYCKLPETKPYQV